MISELFVSSAQFFLLSLLGATVYWAFSGTVTSLLVHKDSEMNLIVPICIENTTHQTYNNICIVYTSTYDIRGKLISVSAKNRKQTSFINFMKAVLDLCTIFYCVVVFTYCTRVYSSRCCVVVQFEMIVLEF